MRKGSGVAVPIALALVAAAAVVGVVYVVGDSRKRATFAKDDPGSPTPPITPVLATLRIGTVVMVNGAKAKIPGAQDRLVRCIVDAIPADASVVGVLALDPALLGFRAEVPRTSIASVEAQPLSVLTS
ncbi:MAG: hypothetical protein JWL95_3242 [Gemmatimonadetes bacterium]|nr:hypothetical protein [Gemmatimonadota bacterium]